jgi:hypothetical protein
VLAGQQYIGIREIINDCFYYTFFARPARFEPAATWFEVRPEGKLGIFGFYKRLIFINFVRGMSVAISPKSTTKHYRVPQNSRNHLALF